MDEDGFFFAQLMNGESGLVPSNFVERVMEEGGQEGEREGGREGERRREGGREIGGRGK